MPHALELDSLFDAAPFSEERGEGSRDGCISVRGLARRFGAIQAVAPLDIELGPGGVIGLIGPNGSGKSTLLRLLTGLVRPDAGTATIDGVALAGDGTAVRQRATFVPGEIHLYGEMRAAEQLEWLLRGRDIGAIPRALAITGALGLDLRARLRTFSHGMKRQLLFASALAPDVRVRLLDEPTEGLDPAKRAIVMDLLRQDARRGTTVLLSSHHFGEVEAVCNRVVFMNAGSIVADETAQSVHEQAKRIVRLRFADLETSTGADLGSRLLGPGVARVDVHGEQVIVQLDEPDPRAFLSALFSRDDIPQPTGVVYGELSLQELYRDLYGVEGY